MLSKLFVPYTVDYMIAGYVVLSLVLSTYLLSIYFRWNKTIKEYQNLKKSS